MVGGGTNQAKLTLQKGEGEVVAKLKKGHNVIKFWDRFNKGA